MTSISSSPNSALLILQAQSSAATDKTTAAAPDLVATANGQPSKQTVGVSTQPTQAESKISDALFSVNNRSITQMKLDLIERTGEELGVKKDDYASTDDFVAAMKKVVTNIKAHKGWEQVVAKIEKDLGLDKLGVSLEDVINSARDPEQDDKVTEALKGHFRPEFLNRIDEVIVFHELARDEVMQMVDLMTKRLTGQLESQGLGIELTQSAKELLAVKGYDPQLGARPTRVCGRADLGATWTAGPLLVEEFDSTTVVPPDGRARLIAWDTIEIELAP